MYSTKEFIALLISPALLPLTLIGFLTTMLVFYKRQQLSFSKEIQQARSNFEKELFKAQFEIQEETLQHISLELHDNVGHYLSLAKLHLTTFKNPLPAYATEKVDTANLLITHSLDEIRNISKSLNTESIKTNGLIKTVQQQIEQLDKLEQFQVYFSVTGKTCYLEDLKEMVLFRIMQECLNNIMKHSRADMIHVGMHYDERELLLSVHDNGIGFIVAQALNNKVQHSSGLKNIIKRSSLINAVPEILSVPGEGTTVNILTPY